MIKKIKKYGNALVIRFSKEEVECLGIKVNDVYRMVDFEKIEKVEELKK